MVECVSKLHKFDGNLWYYYLPISADDGEAFVKENRRIICTLNGTEKFHAALMPDGNGHYFININKARRKKLKIELGQAVLVRIEKDESKYGVPMPESFEILLDQDKDGNELFHKLTIGKQRSLLYLVGKVKSVDIQIRKGIVILDHLKRNKGGLDFKELNQDFKNK